MPQETEQLISALKNPEIYPHPVTQVELIETHISWVFLTGEFVYKIKKPLNLGFLDFSSLNKRKHYCNLELSLNQRLAPAYYLEVISLTGTYSSPVLDGEGEPVEYAVKMRQFPQHAQLDRVLAENKLSFHHMDLLAHKVSEFHQQIQVADEEQPFGDLSHVHSPLLNCFSDILKRLENKSDIKRVHMLRDWSESEFKRLENHFLLRKQQGFIRECHGDLHLRNIAIVDEEVIAFDGIEFSEDLRWNDVISEIAFLVMDLQDHEQDALASRFLNQYLEITGDYSGLVVLKYYLLYRAIVRAMVSSIRLKQEGLSNDEVRIESNNFNKYLLLAESYTKQTKPKLFMTYGLSGSGKSTVSQVFMQEYPAIRIRSDVERKRLCGIDVSQRDKKGVQQGIYNTNTSEKTYLHILQLAETLLTSGFSVVVDAAFLQFKQRKLFFNLAHELQLKLVILECDIDLEILKDRLVKRNLENKDVSDADLEVLDYQIQNIEKLTEAELELVVEIDVADNQLAIIQVCNNLVES